jgi:hypothetical protein
VVQSGELRLHTEVKGLAGTAWFYDPHLERVSPNLAYLRRRREVGGGWTFKYGTTPDVAAQALSRSPTWRRLAAQGQYVPTSYYVVWPRRDLLTWAERHREKIAVKDTY